MKDYFIQVMIETVDVLRELNSTRDFNQIDDFHTVEGTTIYLQNNVEIKVEEDDNTIVVSYFNPANGIESSSSMMWADYLKDAERCIKGILSDVRMKEKENTKKIGERIKDILISGLNLTTRDIITKENTILSFVNGIDEVDFYIVDDSMLSLSSRIFNVSVPLSKITGPDILIEGVIKPYLDIYNKFYK